MNRTFKMFQKLGVYGSLMLLVAIVCGPELSLAQFVGVGPFARMGADQHSIVIPINGHSDSSGLFVAYTDDAFNVQEIDPGKLTTDKSRSFFVRFDRKSNSYSELVLPTGVHYPIRPHGNFSIKIPSKAGTAEGIRVSLSNNPNNPFASIVIPGPKGHSLLVYIGLQEALNISGNEEAVLLLEGNRLLSAEEYKDLIFDFSLGERNELMLNAKPFSGTAVGISVQDENECLRQGALLVNADTVSKIEVPKDASLPDVIRKAAEKTPALARSWDDFLVTNSSRKLVAALDFKSGSVGVIVSKGLSTDKAVCTFSRVF